MRVNLSRSQVTSPLVKPASRRQSIRPLALSKSESNGDAGATESAARRFIQGTGAIATSIALLVSPFSGMVPPALATTSAPEAPVTKTKVVRLPAAKDPEVFAAQRTMLEAWSLVGENFIDDTFGGHSWDEELREHMLAAYSQENGEKAFAELDMMIESLGDRYTRRVPPQEYKQFLQSTEGELLGVGLMIANKPTSDGNLRVVAPIRGGPAARAGVLPGDEVLSINGKAVQGLSGPQAAAMLKGADGTMVRVKFARYTDQIPGVAATPEAAPVVQFKEVSIPRERVAISALYSTALQVSDGHDNSRTVGYLRLVEFSNTAAEDMRKAITDLEAQGATSYILDLRNNPGGLVDSGINIARLWMDGEKAVFNVEGRQGFQAIQTTQTDKAAITHAPLAVLVNEYSASASEILAGALHDNNRAVVLGNKNTFGKGRIQSVFELSDGSALFVTVAKYRTPAGTDIDHKGIRPDRACIQPGGFIGGHQFVSNGVDDETYAPGIPLSVTEVEQAFDAQLRNDSCVLAAQAVLDQAEHSPLLARAGSLAPNSMWESFARIMMMPAPSPRIGEGSQSPAIPSPANE